jgi:histidine triad (HIT) family protein
MKGHRRQAIARVADVTPLCGCIFCRIPAGEVPAGVVAWDDVCGASLDEAEALDADASARALASIAVTTRSAGVADTGYSVITHTGPDAGREVMHLHWHVIGGARLGGMV